MMRPVFALAAIALLAATPASAESRALSGFTAIEASGRLRVEVSQGPHFSVDIDGQRADRVVARVDGDTLALSTGPNWFRSGIDANVRVVMPALTALESSAGVDLIAHNINAGALSLEASSGSDLRVDGTCGSLVADASSGADLHAGGLRCDNVEVSASSGSVATVHARAAVNVDASSGADIFVEGEGRLGRVDISSGADLHHR